MTSHCTLAAIVAVRAAAHMARQTLLLRRLVACRLAQDYCTVETHASPCRQGSCLAWTSRELSQRAPPVPNRPGTRPWLQWLNKLRGAVDFGASCRILLAPFEVRRAIVIRGEAVGGLLVSTVCSSRYGRSCAEHVDTAPPTLPT